jgi:hypothetical protein
MVFSNGKVLKILLIYLKVTINTFHIDIHDIQKIKIIVFATTKNINEKRGVVLYFYKFLSLFAVLGLEFRAYTLNHYTNLSFFGGGFFRDMVS